MHHINPKGRIMKRETKVIIPRKDRAEQLAWCTNQEEKEKIQNYLDNYDWITDISEKFNEKDHGKVCIICGSKAKNLIDSKCYCDKHSHQLKNLKGLRSNPRGTPNEIKLYSDHARLITRDNSGKNITGTAYIDKDSIIKVLDYIWSGSKEGYFSTTINKRSERLHRFLMNASPTDLKVDHKDRDKSNHRMTNLRFASDNENGLNASLRIDSNTRYTGINLVDYGSYRRYIASIKGDKSIHIGSYLTLEEALIERLIAEYILITEGFAPQRDLFEKYDIESRSEGRTKDYYYMKGSQYKFGMKGIIFDEGRSDYRVHYNYRGKQVLRRRFKVLLDAQVARLQAEYTTEGMNAKQAHLFKEFNII